MPIPAPIRLHRSDLTTSIFPLFHSRGGLVRFLQCPAVYHGDGAAATLCFWSVTWGSYRSDNPPAPATSSLPPALLAQGQIEAHLLARRCAAAGDRAASCSREPLLGGFFFFGRRRRAGERWRNVQHEVNQTAGTSPQSLMRSRNFGFW